MANELDPDVVQLNLVFAALADTLKREIVETINDNSGISVNELCDRFSVSRFTIMRNLNALEEAGLLVRKRKGKIKQLHINNQNFKKIASGWLEKIGNSKPQFYDQDAKRKTNNVQLT